MILVVVVVVVVTLYLKIEKGKPLHKINLTANFLIFFFSSIRSRDDRHFTIANVFADWIKHVLLVKSMSETCRVNLIMST